MIELGFLRVSFDGLQLAPIPSLRWDGWEFLGLPIDESKLAPILNLRWDG
jgi:hypothetical protein